MVVVALELVVCIAEFVLEVLLHIAVEYQILFLKHQMIIVLMEDLLLKDIGN